MDEITNRLKIPGWWFTAVVVATLASLAAGYLKNATPAALAGISTRIKKIYGHDEQPDRPDLQGSNLFCRGEGISSDDKGS